MLDTGKETFADFQVTADVLDGAPATVGGSVDAFAAQPTFDVNLEVKKVQLPQVNPWLREYIKADAEAGKFELYMELAAADGKFTRLCEANPAGRGHLPVRRRRAEPAQTRSGKGFLDFAANVLENQERGPGGGAHSVHRDYQESETNLFATIASVMRNAFISAFARSLEGSITLRDVKKSGEIDPDRRAGVRKEIGEKGRLSEKIVLKETCRAGGQGLLPFHRIHKEEGRRVAIPRACPRSSALGFRRLSCAAFLAGVSRLCPWRHFGVALLVRGPADQLRPFALPVRRPGRISSACLAVLRLLSREGRP